MVMTLFTAENGTGWLKGIEIPAGETFRFAVNLDWNRPEIVKDWSFTAWGTKSKVEVRHSEGIESKSLPFRTKPEGSAQPEETEPEQPEETEPVQPEETEPVQPEETEPEQPEPTVPEPTEPEEAQPTPVVPDTTEPTTEESDAGESGQSQRPSQCDLNTWGLNLAGEDDWDCYPTEADLEKCDPNDELCNGLDGKFYEECCWI